jgi:hypothetical protein
VSADLGVTAIDQDPEAAVVENQALVPLRQLHDQLDQLGVAEPTGIARGHRGRTVLRRGTAAGSAGDEMRSSHARPNKW